MGKLTKKALHHGDSNVVQPKINSANFKKSSGESWNRNLFISIGPVFLVVAILGKLYLNYHEGISGKLPQTHDGVLVKDYIPCNPPLAQTKRWTVACKRNKVDPFIKGCHISHDCGRAIVDNFITEEEITQLRAIAEKGMKGRSISGGPTIMDANSGYVKDSDGLINIYQQAAGGIVFSPNDYDLYKRVVEKIRLSIIKEFQLEQLYFSAPTFITRIIGNSSWNAKEIHDEYWHPHVDKDNTQHYDYSGLLYLANYIEDFTGGLFAYLDESTKTIVEPRRGRLSMFTSGKENLHQVLKVENGTRYAMSLWFTCNEQRRFENFLDGKAHKHFTQKRN